MVSVKWELSIEEPWWHLEPLRKGGSLIGTFGVRLIQEAPRMADIPKSILTDLGSLKSAMTQELERSEYRA